MNLNIYIYEITLRIFNIELQKIFNLYTRKLR